MNFEELAFIIGDKAKGIIEADRGQESNNGKVVCFVTDHQSKPHLSWLPSEGSKHGKFYCHNCDEKYDIIDHAKWIAHDDMKEAYKVLMDLSGMKSKSQVESSSKASMPDIKAVDEPEEIDYPSVKPIEEVLGTVGGQYLTGRGIHRDTILAYKVTSNKTAIFFNYFIGSVLVKIKGRLIGNHENGKDKYSPTPKGGTNVLYGQHLYKAQRILIICEGEIDALSLHTALAANSLDDAILASSVPSGSNSTSWIENSRSFISKFEAVVLIGDADEAGKKFLDKASSELVTIVKVRTSSPKPSKGSDVNEILQECGTNEVCMLVTDAKEYVPEFTVDLSKLPIKSESLVYERSGFFMLDKMLHGLGHGLLTLFTGHTGAGKTTILRQMIIFNIQSKRRIGAMMGEETQLMFRNMVIRQMYLKSRPDDFETGYDEWGNRTWLPNESLIRLFNDECSPYVSSFNCAKLVDKDRLKRLYEWMRFEVTIYGTRFFILDNLMKLEAGMGDNLNANQGDIIDTIKNVCQALDVHVLLVAHPKKGEAVMNTESVSGNQKIVNTVDNMVSFQRFDNMEERIASRIKGMVNSKFEYDYMTAFMKVQKNRIWATLGYVPMRYDKHSNCIHDMDPQNLKRYGWTVPGKIQQNEA